MMNVLRRQLVPLLDQGASSLSNVLGVLLVARVLDSASFGIFALVYSGLTLSLGLARSYLGIPIATGASDSLALQHARISSVLSALLLVALPLVVILMAVGALGAVAGEAEGQVWTVIVAVAIATPVVLFHDALRYYLIAAGRPIPALVSDVCWLVGIVVMWPLSDSIGAVETIVLWTSLIPIVTVPLAILVRPTWSFPGAIQVLKPQLGVRESAALSVLVANGTTLVVSLILVPAYGPASVGSLRGAGTLFGPVNTMLAFLDVSVLATLARREQPKRTRPLIAVTATIALLSSVWWFLLLAIPPEWGSLVLGETWTGARAVLPATGVEYLALVITAGILLAFKLRSIPGPLLTTRGCTSVVLLVGVVVAVALGLPFAPVPWIMAGAAVCGCCVAMVALIRRSR